jgi:hypothetical protein
LKGKRNLGFNGTFSTPFDARRKKGRISNGFIVRRKVNGKMRFTVMSKKQGRGRK